MGDLFDLTALASKSDDWGSDQLSFTILAWENNRLLLCVWAQQPNFESLIYILCVYCLSSQSSKITRETEHYVVALCARHGSTPKFQWFSSLLFCVINHTVWQHFHVWSIRCRLEQTKTFREAIRIRVNKLKNKQTSEQLQQKETQDDPVDPEEDLTKDTDVGKWLTPPWLKRSETHHDIF